MAQVSPDNSILLSIHVCIQNAGARVRGELHWLPSRIETVRFRGHELLQVQERCRGIDCTCVLGAGSFVGAPVGCVRETHISISRLVEKKRIGLDALLDEFDIPGIELRVSRKSAVSLELPFEVLQWCVGTHIASTRFVTLFLLDASDKLHFTDSRSHCLLILRICSCPRCLTTSTVWT